MAHYHGLIDEADGHYGISVPDCPGCTAMADTIDALRLNAIDALREWAADRAADGLEMPRPRAASEIQKDPDVADLFNGQQPYPMFMPIPLLLDSGRLVRANISLDAGLLDIIDQAARERNLTRSAFLISAAKEKIAECR